MKLTTKIGSLQTRTVNEGKLRDSVAEGNNHVTIAIFMHFASGHEKRTATT